MSLSCKVNKEIFKAGDSIKLKVGLTVKNDKQGKEIAGSTVRLVIKGEEYSCVNWTDKRADEHYERKAHPLFRVDKDLVKITDEGMKEGFYEYSFQHVLDEDLPSSFHIKRGNEFCCVRYKFEIIMEASGFLSQDQILDFPFELKAKPKDPPARQKLKLLQPDIQQITYCCFFDKGSMSLGCALDKTNLTQHDALTVSFVIKNNSTVDLKQIKLCLYEHAEFKARYKSSKIHKLVTKKVFQPEELIGARKLDKARASIKPGEIDSDLFKILSNSREDSMKNVCTFLIRPDVNPAYGGKNIKVSHKIELTLMTPEMYTNPEVSASIKILPSADMLGDEKNSGAPSVTNPISKKTVVFPGKLSKTAFAKSQRTLSVLSDDEDDKRPDFFRSPSNSSVRFEKSQKSTGLVEEVSIKKIYPVSFDGIIEAMDDTYIDRTLLEKYLAEPELGYKAILLSMNPLQYGSIVGEVNYITDQPAVAEMLAEALDEKFTCEYVASACRMAESANRADIVKDTVDYIVDLKQNRSIIDECLSDFDKVVVCDILNEATN